MKRHMPRHKTRQGFTLIELIFSIAFLSMLVLGATISFVNILGIYNRAQGITRTQDAARNSIDTLSRDLVHTTDVLQGGAAPAVTLTAGVAAVQNNYCLRDSEGTPERGYALLQLADGNFHLARLQNCTTTADYQLLAPLPTWSTSTTSTCTDALVISPVANAEPKVWQVTVRVSQGERNPCPAAGAPEVSAGDTLAATTVLSTHVVRQ